MSGSGGDGHPHKRNLQGLLNFCVENTKNEDASGLEAASEMSDERREWLQEAMQNAFSGGVDPIKVIYEDINVLTNTQSSVEDKENALEDLKDHCEDLDLAKDFQTLGGYSLLKCCLADRHDGYRWRAADLIATMNQNNVPCQQQAMADKLLDILIPLIDNDQSDMVRIKALYAVSCIVRGYPAAGEEFIQKDGFSVLMRALESNVEKLQIKATFLLQAFLMDNVKVKEMLMDMGFVEVLVSLLRTDHDIFHEHLIRVLLFFTKDYSRAVAECRRPELELKNILEEKRKSLQGQEEFEEELHNVNELYSYCFAISQSGTVDR